MANTAAHVVDKVIRPIPVRQWVLTLPFAIRRWRRAACRPEVISALNTILVQTVFAWLRARARDLGVGDGEPGAITFIQRFGDGVKLTPHLHVVVSDGVFSPSAAGPAVFRAVRAPSQKELEQIVARIAAKAAKALAKLDRRGNDAPGFTERCAGVAVQTELSLDDTRRPRQRRGPKPERKLPRLCAEADGFAARQEPKRRAKGARRGGSREPPICMQRCASPRARATRSSLSAVEPPRARARAPPEDATFDDSDGDRLPPGYRGAA